MSDINLTDTEREALIDAYQDGLLNTDGDSTDLTQLGIVVEQIVADRVEAARAAALAPIQALRDEWRRRDVTNAVPPLVAVRRLDAALDAAGVDAAPKGNATRCTDGSVCIRSLRVIEDPDFVMPDDETKD